MPANKKASIRYFVIDKCLRDYTRIYQWADLQTAIAAYLREFHGEDLLPAKRTILADIQAMRSGELGYHAPIVHSRSEGYRYSHPGFSIFKSSVPAVLSEILQEVVSIVNQSLGDRHKSQVLHTLHKLAEHVHVQLDAEYRPIIRLEHSLNDRGYRWLDAFYQLIKSQKCASVQYAPFEGPQVTHLISPWFIQEYNNRWYVFGHHFEARKMYNLALDRVLGVQESIRPYVPCDYEAVDRIFAHLYGVTVPDEETPKCFRFRTSPLLARYLDTKPVHPTQRKEAIQDGWQIFSIKVYDNYEIRSKLRSFGEDLELIESRNPD